MPSPTTLFLRFLIGTALGCFASVLVCFGLQWIQLSTEKEEPDRLRQNIQDVYSDLHSNVSLTQLIQIDSPFDRKQYLYSMKDGLGLDQLVELIEESFSMNLDQRLQSVQHLLFVELAKLDGQTALKQVWSLPNFRWKTLVLSIFEEWSKSSFEEAMSQASLLSSVLMNHAIEVVLRTRCDLPESDRLLESQRYDMEHIAVRAFSEQRARSLLHRPEQALEQILSDSVADNVQLDVLIEIVHAWIDLKSLEALLPLYEILRSHGLSDTRLQRSLFASVIAHEPEKAWEYVKDLPTDVQVFLQIAIVSSWVAIDANQALAAVAQIEDPIQRSELRNRILFDWPAQKPVETLDGLDALGQEHRPMAVSNAIRELARRGKYDDAVQYLQRLDIHEENTLRAKEYLIKAWSKENASDALIWVLENTSESTSLRKKLLKEVLVQLSLSDPPRALQVALEQPFNETVPLESGLEYWVVESLASNGRFDEVLPIMKEVRNSVNFPRIRSYLTVGRNLIDYNLMDQAIALAEGLPESDWPEYFGGLGFIWLSVDPKHLIENLNRIPGHRSRAALAQQILRHQQDRDYLSLDQLEYVRSFQESEEPQ